MDKIVKSRENTVSFLNEEKPKNQTNIKRAKLIKRKVKEYSQILAEEEDFETADNQVQRETKSSKAVKKKLSTLDEAFASILGTKREAPIFSRESDNVLSKYQTPFKKFKEDKKEHDEQKKAQKDKNKLKKKGHVVPSKLKNELSHERELKIVATKGVVKLFNAVSEHQLENKKDHIAEQYLREQKRGEDMKLDSNKPNSNIMIMKNMQQQGVNTKGKVWNVLSEEYDALSGNPTDKNIKNTNKPKFGIA